MTQSDTVHPIVWTDKVNQIPKEVMVSPALYDEERKRIFLGPEWHPVAHEAELAKPGDFKTLVFAGVPLIVSRDAQGKVHALLNSCSHRGTQVETAFRGNRKLFECPYHRWVFDLDGALRSCPKNGDGYCPEFEKKDFPLEKVRMEIFHGLVFVTFSAETPPLLEYLDAIAPILAKVMGGDGRLKLIGYQKVKYQSNWKGYNDSDGYHAPLLHGAFRVLNWQGGKGTQVVSKGRGHIGATSEISLPADGGRSLLKDPSLLEFKEGDTKNGSHVVKMFPLFVCVKHLDVINLRFATPAGVDQTEVHYAYFAHQDDSAEMLKHRVRQASNFLGPSGFVSLEDAAVFQRIHIGNGSPGYATFQKGVADSRVLPVEFHQNEESSNIPKWDYYRQAMGMVRRAK